MSSTLPAPEELRGERIRQFFLGPHGFRHHQFHSLFESFPLNFGRGTVAHTRLYRDGPNKSVVLDPDHTAFLLSFFSGTPLMPRLSDSVGVFGACIGDNEIR